MKQSLSLALLVWGAVSHASPPQPPKAMVTGLTNPESVAVNTKGQVFVSVIGERVATVTASSNQPGQGLAIRNGPR